MLHVLGAKALPNHRLQVRFSNGQEGVVDLSQELTGPIFGAMQDEGLFAQVAIHSLFHTVTWPNGADLAPEFLLDLLQHQQGHAVGKLTITQ